MTNRIATVRSNVLDEELDDNFYLTERAFIIQEASINQGNWYWNSYISRHICNKKDSFFKLRLKNYKFVTADRNIIRLEKVGIIKLALLNRLDMMFLNMAFAQRCDCKLISLS